jgi:hypothetical protein
MALLNSSIESSAISVTQQTDPFAELPMDRIGSSKEFFKWSQEHHTQFIEWWVATSWVVRRVTANKASKSNNDFVKLLSWDSKARTSVYWTSFNQAAHWTSGEPVVVCCKCGMSLTHPSVKNTGTNVLKNHLGTKTCRTKVIQRIGPESRQVSLETAFENSVSKD